VVEIAEQVAGWLAVAVVAMALVVVLVADRSHSSLNRACCKLPAASRPTEYRKPA